MAARPAEPSRPCHLSGFFACLCPPFPQSTLSCSPPQALPRSPCFHSSFSPLLPSKCPSHLLHSDDPAERCPAPPEEGSMMHRVTGPAERKQAPLHGDAQSRRGAGGWSLWFARHFSANLTACPSLTQRAPCGAGAAGQGGGKPLAHASHSDCLPSITGSPLTDSANAALWVGQTVGWRLYLWGEVVEWIVEGCGRSSA